MQIVGDRRAEKSNLINTNAYLSILTIHVISSSSRSLLSAMNFIEVKRKISLLSHNKMQPSSQPFRIERCDLQSPRKVSRMLRRLTAVSTYTHTKKDFSVQRTKKQGCSYKGKNSVGMQPVLWFKIR